MPLTRENWEAALLAPGVQLAINGEAGGECKLAVAMISTSRCLVLVLLIGLPGPAAGGSPDEAGISASSFTGSFTGPLAANLGQAGRKLVALAEEIPAEEYSWRPSPEVRSVSEVFMHVAVGNFQLPASIGGGPPEGVEIPSAVWDLGRQRQEWEQEIVDKVSVVDLLRRSFAYAAEAIPSISDLDAEVATWGFPASKRDYLLILQGHAHEHLGQMIAYARGLGITPPWSQRPEPVIAASVARIEGSTAHAEIASIDDWGNLLTTFVPADLQAIGVAPGEHLQVDACGGTTTVRFGDEMFDVRPGEWIALPRPDGHLTIAVSYGSAAEGLGCGELTAITIRRAD